MIRARRLFATLGTLTFLLIVPAAAQAGFGIEPGSLHTSYEVSKGLTGVPQASSHPYSFKLGFKLSTDSEGHSEGGELRSILVDLPPGFAGNPFAVNRCTRQEFEGFGPACSPNTQVGILTAKLTSPPQTLSGPIYNMVPPPGSAAQLGFSVAGLNALQEISLRSETPDPAERYGLLDATYGLPLEVTSVEATIWGAPADPGHDEQRGAIAAGGGASQGHAYIGPHIAFLTLPAECSQPIRATVEVDSKLDPGHYVKGEARSLDPGGNPAAPQGCASVPFAPQVAAQPTSRSATSPSGLDFQLKLPNEGLTNPGGIAETEPQKVEVTLPEGMTANPSFAEGIGTCSEAQYKVEAIDTPAGAGCPEASKLGSVLAHSPLLDEPIEGSLYLATPHENEFHSLVAVYMVLRASERGVLIKQAGEVKPDPVTGRLRTSFEGLPPLPFSDFTLHFREGARAPLATPRSCGEYRTIAQLYPFSAPTTAVEKVAAMQIESGPNAGPCPSGGTPPFHPGLEAGSINNAAGAYSPFNVRLFRGDAEQEITHFSIKLPPGVTGKLAGIPFCSDAAIAAAKARTGPHGGEEELNSPSCPAASEVGHTLVGAGVGSSLTYVPGKVYLAGPYHGSQLSIVAITAAKAGPFDLGTVVVREALKINPETAEVFIDATGSDPIPHIIQGIPVAARDIRVYVDRPNFMLNPTSCEPTSTASTVLGSGLDFGSEADDQPVTVTTRFQAADCASLGFAPKLALSLKGGTRRNQVPAFKAVLTYPQGPSANIAKAQITLPRSVFLDNEHIGTVCTRPVFNEGAVPGEKCPAASVYGHAQAITPLLDEPIEGPVFLRANGGERNLPDLVAALHSGKVNVNLVGYIDSLHKKGSEVSRIRNTFALVPDAPVSKFTLEMAGGKKGLLINSANLCKSTNKALAAFTGQNGKQHDFEPVLKPLGCKGKAKKQAKRSERRNLLAHVGW